MFPKFVLFTGKRRELPIEGCLLYPEHLQRLQGTGRLFRHQPLHGRRLLARPQGHPQRLLRLFQGKTSPDAAIMVIFFFIYIMVIHILQPTLDTVEI